MLRNPGSGFQTDHPVFSALYPFQSALSVDLQPRGRRTKKKMINAEEEPSKQLTYMVSIHMLPQGYM